MKKLIVFFGILLLFVIFSKQVYAKRLLPFLQPAKSGTTTITSTKGVSTKVKFRGDRRAIIVNFSNLLISTRVDYVLSYTSRGTMQGASGTIKDVGESTLERELIFGTCSHGVCRYDSGITNAKFTVVTTLKNGRKVSKSFKLKV